MKHLTHILCMLLLSMALVNAQEDYKDPSLKTEYTHLTPHAVETYIDKHGSKAPKNIILLIGDGMGYAHYYAGLTANKGNLNINNMKYMGMSKTSSTNNYTTDSAAGGTALATGKKTYNGAISVNTDSIAIPTILEQAEMLGKATGLVSTSAITHATPASFIAHQNNRGMYEAIALDFLNTDIDVFIGGGSDFFTKRVDGRNLMTELEHKDYTVGTSLKDVKKIKKGKIAVLTAEKHNPTYTERGDMLPQATKKALKILDNNSKEGFFIMVEGSQIDWGGHQNDITFVIEEMLDFDRAVGEALAFAAKDKNTLVIVTADHETGGITFMDGDEKLGYVKVNFSTGHHTGIGVPVFAFGPGAEEFIGVYENTEIYHKMAKLWNIE